MGQEARKSVLEVRCPVTVPREIGSLSRMNDNGTNIIVSQQRTSAVRQADRLRGAANPVVNIRTSHPLAPALECSDVRLVGQETRKRVVEVRCPVTVPREIGSLSRMNDDGTNIIVSQQRRDLVFGDWASAAIFVPRRVWIGEELLHHLLRCYFRAVLSEPRPEGCQQLYSDAWLIWSAREVNRRPTCLLGPTTTSMLRNLQ